MNIFLEDLWADLREKRLWPVAVLLVVGLIAVPLVLAKPASEPEVAPPPPVKSDETAGVDVLPAEETTSGSALDLFDPKNPFRPPESVLAAKDAASRTARSSPAGAGASDPGTGSAPGDTGGSTGGDFGGFTVPDGGGSPAPPKRTVEQFTYVIDATFWRGDNRRKVRGMARLEMLPNESSPLLIFLGVDASASNAVFLVDSSLESAGEGTCKPNNEECSFLYLGAGSVHEFSNDKGDSYAIRVDQIRRVKVKAVSASPKAKRRRAQESERSGHSNAQDEADASDREPFVPSFLADLVSISNGEGSKTRRQRR
jgi:hypothetical protein